MANVRVIDKYYMGPIFPELPEVLIAKANYELTVKRNGMEILCFSPGWSHGYAFKYNKVMQERAFNG